MSGLLLPAEQWYAQLPTAYACAGALITDTRGQVLLVKPNYRDGWSMPGGVVDMDTGEMPHEACAREVREEIGLDLPVGRLVAIDLSPSNGARPLPMVVWIFDVGTLGADQIAAIRLQEDELDAYTFVQPSAIAGYLPDTAVARIPAALEGRRTGGTVYMPTGVRDAMGER